MCSAPFRWKQYEAYVQVLEAKYADLCCKCNTNIILCNENALFLQACRSITCILLIWLILNGFWCTFQCFPPPFQPMMWRDWRSQRRSWSSSSRSLHAGRTFWLWDLRLRSRKCKSAQYVFIIPFLAIEKFDIFIKIKILFTGSQCWPCLILAIIVVVDY